MANHDAVKKIMRAATNDVCDNLDADCLTKMMSTLQFKNALLTNDLQTIRSKTTDEDKADELLLILQRKPVTAYDSFMETLIEIDKKDIYDKVKPLETKHGYRKPGRSRHIFW